jgi:hypothetical protein
LGGLKASTLLENGHNKRKKSQGHQQERREDSTTAEGTVVLASPAVCDLDTSWSRAMRGVYCCKCSREVIFKRETSRALVQIVAMGNLGGYNLS